jgi:hypothetical protein
MDTAEFNKKTLWLNTPHHDDYDNFKRNLNLRQPLVQCYIWRTTSSGAKTWTLQKVDPKYLEIFEMRSCRRMEKISWTDGVKKRKHYKELRRGAFYTK